MVERPDIVPIGTEFFPGMESEELHEPAKVSTKAEYDALYPGRIFIDPQGVKRTKQWEVSNAEDYEQVPEGVEYRDPEGALRTKPRSENIGFAAQALYDMAVNPTEKRKALARTYGDEFVKQNEKTGEFYVEKEGKTYRPKGGLGTLAAMAVPVSLATLGAIGGGGLGTAAEPGGGTLVGGMAGAAGGSILGQEFNDVVMQLAGTYDRTPAEKLTEMGLGAAASIAGGGVGRGLAAVAPGIKGGVRALGPQATAHFLGARLPETAMARQLAEKGEKQGTGVLGALGMSETDVQVPPSSHLFEAPHIHNMAEVFDPAFHTEKPFVESAARHYETEGRKLLEGVGVTREESLASPTKATSSEKAGVSLLARARQESQVADERLQQALDARLNAAQQAAETKSTQLATTTQSLRQAEEQSRQAAQKLIDAGFVDIQKDVDQALAATKAGTSSGALWWQVGEKIREVRKGIMGRARKMYDEADALAGDHLPNTAGLSEDAENLLAQLPEGFEGKYPDIVKRIRDLAGVKKIDKEGNVLDEWQKEPVQPTFGQLHNLRSVLRSNVNWYDLTPDVREGVYKLFSGKIDDVLHDVKAIEPLREASRALDRADAFYRENMGPLNDRNIQAVMNGLEAGMPADPKMLYNVLFKEGRSDLAKKVMDMVGPNLGAAIKAADVQEMLDASKSLVPGVIDGTTFAREVLTRDRANMLEPIHGAQMAAKLRRQAQDIAMLQGKLDIGARPRDTAIEVIERARTAAKAVKDAAQKDPLTTLQKDMRGIETSFKREAARLRQERNSSPLGFLYNPTVGASEAVDRILGSEDLILAAAYKFGEQSPEFNLLRQVHVQRILENTMRPGERLAKISPEVQQIMFPGVTLDQMRTLAKEMDFLMDTKAFKSQGAGSSMSAFSKVEHPLAGRLGTFVDPFKLVPGANPTARAALGSFYSLIRRFSTSPSFLRFVERGLKGNEQERAAVKQIVQRAMRRGHAIGTGVGETVFEQPSEGFEP